MQGLSSKGYALMVTEFSRLQALRSKGYALMVPEFSGMQTLSCKGYPLMVLRDLELYHWLIVVTWSLAKEYKWRPEMAVKFIRDLSLNQ